MVRTTKKNKRNIRKVEKKTIAADKKPKSSLQEGHTVVAHLPTYFCLQDHLQLVDAVSSASSVSFGKDVYCQCKDAATAVQLTLTLNKRVFSHNAVNRARRLGPAFCASVSSAPCAKVLTVVKLDARTTHEELLEVFPTAVDIEMKKSSAKVAFESSKKCEKTYEKLSKAGSIQWPYGAVAKIQPPPADDGEKENLPASQPTQFVTNPSVVALALRQKFDFMADIDLIRELAGCQKIYFAETFAATFSVAAAARMAKDALCRASLPEGGVSCFIHYGKVGSGNVALDDGKIEESSTTKQEGEDSSDNDNLDSSDEESDENDQFVPKKLRLS